MLQRQHSTSECEETLNPANTNEQDAFCDNQICYNNVTHCRMVRFLLSSFSLILQHIMNYSWEHIRTQVRQFRASMQTIYPVQVLATTKDFVIHNNVLYFLSNNRDASDWCPTRHMQIYKSTLDQCGTHIIQQNEQDYLTAISNIPIMERSLVYNDCIALVENELDKSTFYRQLQLPGVSTFDIKDDTIMFTFHNNVYVGKIGEVIRGLEWCLHQLMSL